MIESERDRLGGRHVRGALVEVDRSRTQPVWRGRSGWRRGAVRGRDRADVGQPRDPPDQASARARTAASVTLPCVDRDDQLIAVARPRRRGLLQQTCRLGASNTVSGKRQQPHHHFHAPSRRTDASRRAATSSRQGSPGPALLEQSECGIEHEQTGDHRGLDIFAEQQLKHDRGLSIHGTGAQTFSSAIRNGWSDVSGIAFGPNFASRRRASSLVKPPRRSSVAQRPTW